MINIKELFSSPNGTKEPFELELGLSSFPDLPLEGAITFSGDLLRIQEGIMIMITKLTASQKGQCVRCGKKITLPISFEPSEWLFYERRPADFDDENELMQIDKENMQIDPTESIRQEVILNLDDHPHCDPPCKEFKEPEKGVKALKGLKGISP